VTRPDRSPEALPLELHLLNKHGLSADQATALNDNALEMRHALLHADEAERDDQ
jgi:hypothetical protein